MATGYATLVRNIFPHFIIRAQAIAARSLLMSTFENAAKFRNLVTKVIFQN
jgi:hypothetical protein